MHRNVALRNVRFNWLQVLEPSFFQKGDVGRYRAECIIEPDTEADKRLDDAVNSAAEDKWPGKAKGMLKVAVSGGKCCRKVGDDMPVNKKTFELPEHYAGNTVLSTSRVDDRDGPPRVFCKRISTGKLVEVTKDTVFDEDLIKPVPGSYGDVMVSIWGWEFGGSPQLNCTLDAIAFTGEGDALGGRGAISDDTLAAGFCAEIEASENPFG